MNWFKSKLKYLLFLFLPLLAFCSVYTTKESSSLGSDIIVSSSGKKFYTGLLVPKGFQPKVVKSALTELKNKGIALPETYDLRTKYSLDNAWDQGSCGSCWAMAIAGVFKDVLKINGVTRNLSTQFLLDCNSQGYSCEGGFFQAHDLHKSPKGGVNASDYPYTGSQGACKSGLKYNEKILTWAYTPGGEKPSVDEIKAAIFAYGTVAVGIAASQGMSNYTGGIWAGDGSTELNHAVNLVGWGVDHWILKNSWGNWGENGGYMRLKFNANSVGAWANYVTFNGSPSPDPTPDPNPNPTPNPTPDPNPTPNPTPPPPCSPAPRASTGYGAETKIRKYQTIYLGMKPAKDTTYLWSATPPFNGNAVPKEPYIKFTPSVTKVLTIFATNKCGTAQASTKVIVN